MVCLDLSQVVIVERVASAPARFDKFGFPLRRQTLYPTELRAHALELIQFTAFVLPIATGTIRQRCSLRLSRGPCFNV
jgi:hypothetical protein